MRYRTYEHSGERFKYFPSGPLFPCCIIPDAKKPHCIHGPTKPWPWESEHPSNRPPLPQPALQGPLWPRWEQEGGLWPVGLCVHEGLENVREHDESKAGVGCECPRCDGSSYVWCPSCGMLFRNGEWLVKCLLSEKEIKEKQEVREWILQLRMRGEARRKRVAVRNVDVNIGDNENGNILESEEIR